LETKIIGKKEVKLFTDVEEIFIPRYSKFNKYMVLNEEVGHNFNDVDAHFSKIYALINSPAKLKTQIDNFRQLIYSIDREQNFLNMAYACLVYSIDGVKCDDLTVTGINETLAKLTELKAKDVKKKSTNFLKMLMQNLKNLTVPYSKIKGS
jgi:hypothetical protein